MNREELDQLTLTSAARLIREKALSPVELTRAVLERIEALNPATHAFITVTAEAAMEQASRAEAALAGRGTNGPLHGVPVSLKDLFDTEGVLTTAGSKVFAGRVPTRDATVVSRLKAAGAVLVGKTNMHEFAFGITSENPHYGAVRNPWDHDRIAGGSSGGSAVSVALSMALGSLGTDTGGSIRIPSALSGTVGLKPTYGRVSGTGVIPLAWSFDTFGPMTRCVEDAALLLEVISGIDREDPRTRLAPEPGYTSRGLGGGIRGFRIGIPSSAFDRTDPEIENLVRAALGKLEALGARLIPLDLPGVDRHEEVFSAIAGFEVLSWHRRYLDETPEAYGEATRVRIERGSQVTPERYLAAQRERMKLQAEVQECFESVDLFALPASPVPAPKVGEDPVTILGSKEPVLGALTRPHRLFSITGVPAISVPCGWTGSGLPAGLQLAGAAFDEARVLQAAWAYEQDTLWRPHRGPA